MPLKIDEVTPVLTPAITPVKDKNINDDFAFTLKKLGDDGLSERINNLVGEITQMGKQIAKHMDIRDLKKYKSLISDFINEVVTNSHKFGRENFLDRRGRHRVYRNVKVVNQELDDLAQELLKQEKDHVAILGRIDEINGLLLDMII